MRDSLGSEVAARANIPGILWKVAGAAEVLIAVDCSACYSLGRTTVVAAIAS
jgi:hypothetical protein